jgi:integrating conjugative element protein (TIGR03756 family)
MRALFVRAVTGSSCAAIGGARAWAVASVLALLAAPAPAQQSLTSAEIIAQSLSLQCLNYQPLQGVCVWLDCTPFGCSLVAVPKIRHFSPDVVVSAYHETGENPWRDVRPLVRAAQGPLEGGVAAEGVAGQHTNLRFKNVDVFGHPLAGALNAFGPLGLTCQSAAQPFEPYFISTLDTVAWRFGIPESVFPQALIPGVREVSGTMGALGTWGSLYPRSGFLIQAHDYKAGAVTAQRAANVITQTGQPHVYRPVVADAEPGYWPPGEAIETDPETARWQRLLPAPEDTCHIFGEINDLRAGLEDAYAEAVSEAGDYVWNLWRPYECCEAAGDILLFSIDF